MEETVSLFQSPYALLTLLFSLLAAAAALLLGKKHGMSARATGLYCLLAAMLSLLIGRLLYCAVQFEFMFYDELGEFAGLSPFFDAGNGSVNVGGVLLGLLLAAPLTGLITKEKPARLLDTAALPGLFLYSALRFIEPLSGQGYGEMIENESLCFFPLAMSNDWGEWVLAVCHIEGVLTLILLVVLFCLRNTCRRPGTLAMYTLILFSTLQVLPECLRCDDVLFVLIFARVTHIVLAVVMFGTLAAALFRGKRRGLVKYQVFLEAGLMLLGEILCIGTIFALDKTNLPDLMVYLVMTADLVFMALLTCRRIHKEDQPCIEE